jgi:hypothetical protein
MLMCAAVGGQSPASGRNDAPSPGFDISGYWTSPLYEDAMERGAGPELGDYGGFPINEAARLFALSYDASRVTLRHHQCDGYVAPHSVRSIGNARAWEERDPHTQRLAIVRDRVQALARKGAALDQVKTARPTADYDTRYGAMSGTWTTDRFVEAVYATLSRRP